MRLCFLTPNYPSQHGGSGVGTQVRTLARGLVRHGHAVTVVALANAGTPGASDDQGVAVWRARAGNLHWYAYKLPVLGRLLVLALRELEYARALYAPLRQLHRQQPFDLIEATETGAIWAALRMRHVPLIARLHGEEYTFHKYTPDLPQTPALRLCRAVQRAGLRRARLLISPSQAHAQEIQTELGQRCPPLVVIPNSLDSASFGAPIDSGNNHTVLFVGRIERVKGVPTLLEAARLVVEACPDAQILLAGAAHPNLPQQEVSASIERLGLAHAVKLLGHLPQDQLLECYRSAALCVLPSHYETFGLAALEAMAYGIPVVASATGGLPEVLAQGRAGVLVPPGDVPALAQAIIGLLRDPLRRRQLGQAGRQHARAQFSIEQVLGKTLSVYQRSVRDLNNKTPGVIRKT
jgi:glycogen synthase